MTLSPIKLGWTFKKGEEGQYAHKSEHEKKGFDAESKKWGHKKAN